MTHVAFRATDEEAATLDALAAARGLRNRSQALRLIIAEVTVEAPAAEGLEATIARHIAALKRLLDLWEIGRRPGEEQTPPAGPMGELDELATHHAHTPDREVN